MKANTKPAKPIDLSTCQIGQKLRLRNESIATLGGIDNETSNLFKYDAGAPLYHSWTKEGRAPASYYLDVKSELDVVAILPLPKPKKPRATPAAPKMSKKEILKAITYFRGILQALEDQIKP